MIECVETTDGKHLYDPPCSNDEHNHPLEAEVCVCGAIKPNADPILGRLQYLSHEAARLAEKVEYGGDPEHDLVPATQYAVGQVLRLVADLIEIVKATR